MPHADAVRPTTIVAAKKELKMKYKIKKKLHSFLRNVQWIKFNYLINKIVWIAFPCNYKQFLSGMKSSGVASENISKRSLNVKEILMIFLKVNNLKINIVENNLYSFCIWWVEKINTYENFDRHHVQLGIGWSIFERSFLIHCSMTVKRKLVKKTNFWFFKTTFIPKFLWHQLLQRVEDLSYLLFHCL